MAAWVCQLPASRQTGAAGGSRELLLRLATAQCLHWPPHDLTQPPTTTAQPPIGRPAKPRVCGERPGGEGGRPSESAVLPQWGSCMADVGAWWAGRWVLAKQPEAARYGDMVCTAGFPGQTLLKKVAPLFRVKEIL